MATRQIAVHVFFLTLNGEMCLNCGLQEYHVMYCVRSIGRMYWQLTHTHTLTQGSHSLGQVVVSSSVYRHYLILTHR